jgi:hypothetical protein
MEKQLRIFADYVYTGYLSRDFDIETGKGVFVRKRFYEMEIEFAFQVRLFEYSTWGIRY